MSMADVEIRKSTPEDEHDFYGPTVPYRIDAWTAFYKGQRVAIAGIRFNEHGKVVFSDVKEGITAPRMTIFKACRALIGEIRKTRVPAITVCFPEMDGLQRPAEKAGRFLELMGFRYSHWDPLGYAIYELKDT